LLNVRERHRVATGGLPEVATGGLPEVAIADVPPIQGPVAQNGILEPSAAVEESQPADNAVLELPMIQELEPLSKEVVEALLAQLGKFLLPLASVLAQS
jgi:hypothetical protein